MKKSLLLIICSLSALAGAAQTYVSVSNFNANIGSSATTVTFNVSWTSAGNDSVWVFVDYNTQGTMKRLPLTGATTTLGTVHRPDNNNQGAWVIAPASGEFATTVTLSSGTTYSYGSCAYAIPQPPTGQYTAYNVIKFTGTPPFDLTFKDAGGSVSVAAGTYTLPAGKTPASFTDATRAPGVFTCVMPTINRQPESKSICYGTTQLNVSASPAAAFRWYEDGTLVQESSGTTTSYIAQLSSGATTYTVTATIGACSVTSREAVVSTMPGGTGTAPGSTVTFADFNPCMDAAVGSTWRLADMREEAYGNAQTYTVRMLQDGQVWMVQDMKFGHLCSTDFSGSDGSDQTGNVSNIGTYYGDCTAATNTFTPSNRGYLYDWAAAINKQKAYHGSSINVGCSGTNGASCQGICPEGWHLPTGGSYGEFTTMATSVAYIDNASCFAGVRGGSWSNDITALAGQGDYAVYWSSTYVNAAYTFVLNFNSSVLFLTNAYLKFQGFSVRCVKN